METKTTHTTGPWTACTGWVRAESGKGICYRPSTSESIQQDEADLCLCAAAPDLLAAARLTIEQHRLVRDSAPCPCRGCASLRAAVARAEGREVLP